MPPPRSRSGSGPSAVAVNPVTNKTYVANLSSANVTVIDGATNATTTVAAGSNPWGVAVNPVTNKVYVANSEQRQRDGHRRGDERHHHGDGGLGTAVRGGEPGYEQGLRRELHAATT